MENLFSFFEDAPEAFWVIDQSYRLVYANKCFLATIENTFGSPVTTGDVVLDFLDKDSDQYIFWKNSYDKAFQFKSYTTELSKKDSGGRGRTRFDFRLIEAITKFLCIRAVGLDTVTREFIPTSLAKDMNEFSLSIDEDGNILRISPAVQNLLGYFTEWIESKSVIDFLHPDEKDILRSFFRSNESMEGTWCRIRDVNGKYFWCNIQMAAFGKMQVDRRYVISINEIRIQKTPANSYVPDANVLQIISEAQGIYINSGNAQKAFYTCLLYFQNEGIAPFSFLASLQWSGTKASLKTMAGCGTWVQSNEHSMEELLKHLAEKCFDIQKGINNKVQQEINNGFAFHFQHTNFMMYLLISNSEIIGVLVTSDLLNEAAIPNVQPSITYFRPLFVSILQSDRFIKNANDAVRKLAVSKDELQSLVTSLDDIILEVNTCCEIVNIWSNEKATLSLPKEIMKGKKIREIKGDHLGELFEETVQKVLATESSHFIEYADSFGGVMNWHSAKMNLVRMFNGEKRVSILIADITQQKTAESAVEEALKKEKELNEMKSKMITSVSHEFRTPLATIVSSTELLEMNIKKNYAQIGERAAELFSNIYEEVERLSDMMRNFLVMGRFEENQMPFRPKETDVAALVKQIIRSRFHVKYGEEKVQLQINYTPRTAEIDPSLFWHIITNLVSNAIKYSAAEKKVTVELDFLEEEFLLSVKDNGIGIPQDDLANIFQSFYRARNSDEHSGYGLGLSIVDRFLKMHKAKIEVQSEVGRGSEFIIHFKYNIL